MARKLALSVAAFVLLASCEGVSLGEFTAFGDGTNSIRSNANREYYPDEQALVEAKAQFREGNYGRSFRLFKSAIDRVGNDPEALLGYAASADMLARFDEADEAYRALQPVIGTRIEFLNNYGYSMLLRGDLVSARRYFLRAYEIDPSNAIAANNLEMLRNSVTYPRRSPGDLSAI